MNASIYCHVAAIKAASNRQTPTPAAGTPYTKDLSIVLVPRRPLGDDATSTTQQGALALERHCSETAAIASRRHGAHYTKT